MSLEITEDFNEPYFGVGYGSLPSNVSPSVVALDGVPYLLDTSQERYSRQGVAVVQQRNTNDARDVLLLPQDVWRQQVQSWHKGAGQSAMDRDESDIYRYDQSFGVDPWTKWQVSLLNETARLDGTEGFSQEIWLTTQGEYLTVVNDGEIWWYDSLTASAAVGSTVVSSGFTALDIANTGHVVTVLMSDRYIWTVDGPSGTPTKWSNQQYTTGVSFIAWEKDYLLVGDGNKLYNALKGNNPVLVFTHPDADFRWYSAASGNSCIYLLGRLGNRTTIHRVNIKSDGTGLNPCIVAASLPDGEVGYSIDSYLGFILIGTDKGVRVAQTNNDAGDLTLGPVIPTAAPVRCFEGQDRFVWYGNSSIDGSYSIDLGDETYFPDAPVSGLGRMDLSVTTVNQLTPAYANDIYAYGVDAGVVRSVVTFQDKRVFSIDGGGVWYQTDNLVPAGWVSEGKMSFSVEDPKTALYMQVKWEPLVGEINCDISWDSAPYRRIVEFKIPGSIRSGNISLNGWQFSRVNPRHVLKRNTVLPTEGPILTRWEIRAVPVKGRASRWTLPIMNYEEIEIDGVKYTRDPKATVDRLIGLVESGRLFILQEAGRSYQVTAKDFAWQPEKLTINGKAWEGVFTIVVEEVA